MPKTVEKPEAKQETPEQRAERIAAEKERMRDKPQATFKERERTKAERIAESRQALNHPLEPGQKLFESPDGFIIVGEADADRVWCNKANDGKGMWINPYRAGNVSGAKKKTEERK